ncbi:diguanylate cyclase domain-containing protein [Vibrio mediterranei]|uniref:Diguanylate cyclase n=1 Tax=Vibrio mediterranei TaxID=689 RepID=A0A3G4VL69_9VIBR|nr:diguanylate cyclase [Vibrio mediterranei]AYV24758.1 diguanylate cyclase [Vibrio mediterranei]
MTICVLGKVPQLLSNSALELKSVALNETLLAQSGVVCVLNLNNEEQDRMLSQIHRSNYGWSWRVFTCQPSFLSDYLSDGLVDSDWLSSKEKHLPFEKLNRIINEPSDKLLAYLWLDEARTLSPMKVISETAIYRYPLLDIYHNQVRTPFRYLHRLVDADLIEADQCVDRVRYCHSCQSGHLNFVDTCPSCHSIDIKTFDALHCFTCGHVDDAKLFLSRRTMSCPKCHTELKHIGVDYDRPLELYDCNNCHQEFVESDVVAKCMTCDHTNSINELTSRSYYHYSVGESAQRYLLDDQLESKRNIILSGSVTTSVFEATLAWKNQLSLRHKHQDLLIGIKVQNIDDYILKFGDVAYIEFISAFSEQLESLFRTTDLSCQYTDDVFFILLPHCESSFLSVIETRISEFAGKVDSELLSLIVKSWLLPSIELSVASEWLSERKSELND